MSLQLGPRGLLVFEDYAKGKSGNERKNRQAIPGAPQLKFSIADKHPLRFADLNYYSFCSSSTTTSPASRGQFCNQHFRHCVLESQRG